MSGRVIPFPVRMTHAERRRSPRGRALLAGRILYLDGACSLDVTVRNLATHGALIEGDGLAKLPDPFTLAFTSRGFARSATVRWNRLNRAGVALGSVGPL